MSIFGYFYRRNNRNSSVCFLKACEYGIRASIYIASQTQIGNRVSLVDVVKKIESPEAFTSKYYKN